MIINSKEMGPRLIKSLHRKLSQDAGADVKRIEVAPGAFLSFLEVETGYSGTFEALTSKEFPMEGFTLASNPNILDGKFISYLS